MPIGYAINHRMALPGGTRGDKWRRFKRRLRWLLLTTGESTPESIAEEFRKRGESISQATISRWMQDDNDAGPDWRQLILIGEMHKNVSIDWLLGRKEPESIDERFIEGKI